MVLELELSSDVPLDKTFSSHAREQPKRQFNKIAKFDNTIAKVIMEKSMIGKLSM